MAVGAGRSTRSLASTMFRIKLPLEPLAHGERDVWATLSVKLTEPIRTTDDPPEPPLIGYFRNFGVRLRGDEPHRLLERLIDDGSVDWGDSEYREIEPASLDRAIRKRIVAPDTFGVWYRSGRMFYPAENGAG